MHCGTGPMRLAFISIWIFFLIFSPWTLLDWHDANWGMIGWPMFAGSMFFLGHVFTLLAVRVGDVSLQNPLMGIKTLLVALFAVMLGIQQLETGLVFAALGMTLAIILLALPDKLQTDRPALTLFYTFLSCLFFAIFDLSIAVKAQAFGAPWTFLTVTMFVGALLSLSLMPFFRGGIKVLPPTAWKWIYLSGFMMALQCLFLAIFLAFTGKAAEGNIAYSTRGLWSVLLPLIIASQLQRTDTKMSRSTWIRRILGASIMSLSIYLLFQD